MPVHLVDPLYVPSSVRSLLVVRPGAPSSFLDPLYKLFTVSLFAVEGVLNEALVLETLTR